MTYTKTVFVNKNTLALINRKLRESKPCDVGFAKTVKFTNGYSVYIKAAAGTPWAEGVLFHHGSRLRCTTPGSVLEGEYRLTDPETQDEYIVIITTDPEVEFTHKDYLDHKCSHATYYAQFVNSHAKGAVLNLAQRPLLRQLLSGGDDALNKISMNEWMRTGRTFQQSEWLRDRMAAAEDFVTDAGLTSILKEAAFQLAEENDD